MIIKSHSKDYSVNLEPDFDFFAKLKDRKNSLFVVDRNVYLLYKDILFSDMDESDIYILDAVEENKNMESVLKICEVFTTLSAKRNALLISVGGGIVQDITGFAANILYRGINWIFVPTTLLASCDSCVGSKTSLNYKQYKNLLGTFYPPDEIYICPEFFKTLTDVDFKSGLGEVVKFNVMSGTEGISLIEHDIDRLLERDTKLLNRFVEKSIAFKKPFVEKDEYDKAERIYLNFAHTFGHAIETVSHYKIPHGSAVAIGMLIANRISISRGYFNEDIALRIEKIVRKILTLHLDPEYFEIDQLVNAIRKDKKQISESLTAVLLTQNMNIDVFHDILPDEISGAITYVQKILNI